MNQKIKISLFICFFINLISNAQIPDDILNLFLTKKIINPAEFDSLKIESFQQKKLQDKNLNIQFEFRPRAEYRHGYGQLANDTTYDAFFLSHRARLASKFTIDENLILQFTIHDVRVYGQQNPKGSSPSTLQVFEAWAEPTLAKNLSIRIGRQKISYDNQRLFSENNWRQTGVSHDAIVFKMAKKTLTSDLVLAYNQNRDQYSGTYYNPKDFSNFETLIIHYLYYHKNFSAYTLLNSCDGYQDIGFSEKQNFRYTNGGRIEFWKGYWYSTINAYWQWGIDSKNNKIEAFYFNPEIKYQFSRINSLLSTGVEWFSGNKNTVKTNTNRSFQPIVGSGHAFNGSLDLITKFPDDIGGAGLFNPYLNIQKILFKKIIINSSKHLFYLNNNYYVENKIVNPYLGFEHDLHLTYERNDFVILDIGYSYAFITKTFEIIKKAKNNSYHYHPTWFFFSISIKPEIFNYSFK